MSGYFNDSDSDCYSYYEDNDSDYYNSWNHDRREVASPEGSVYDSSDFVDSSRQAEVQPYRQSYNYNYQPYSYSSSNYTQFQSAPPCQQPAQNNWYSPYQWSYHMNPQPQIGPTIMAYPGYNQQLYQWGPYQPAVQPQPIVPYQQPQHNDYQSGTQRGSNNHYSSGNYQPTRNHASSGGIVNSGTITNVNVYPRK